MKNFIFNLLADVYYRQRMLAGYYGYRVWEDLSCLTAMQKQTEDIPFLVGMRGPNWLERHMKRVTIKGW